MTQTNAAETLGLPRDLGNGLVLRWATPADTTELAEFNANIHSDTDQPDEYIRNWILELMNGHHPTTGPGDFTVVVDRNNGGKIVSSLNLISQTWSYAGIPFGAGRPELVGTSNEYRRKGLVRLQMEVVHARSAARGEMLQFITGIPWYYRQFGYSMALDLHGGRRFYWPNASKLENGKEESYRLRPANLEDILRLHQLYEIHCRASLVSRVRDQAQWRYELTRTVEKAIGYRRFYIVEEINGGPVGYLEAIPYQQQGGVFAVRELAVLPGNSLRAVAEFLTRALKDLVDELNKERPQPLQGLSFAMGHDHPVYQALGNQLERTMRPYAFFIRVPDLPGFIRHIGPALENRLVGSVVEGHTGVLKLNFYRNHLALDFERGKLTGVGTYSPTRLADGDAVFPELTFLELLFGRRSLEELSEAYPDCYPTSQRARVLIDALFPKKPSSVAALE